MSKNSSQVFRDEWDYLEKLVGVKRDRERVGDMENSMNSHASHSLISAPLCPAAT